MKHQVGTSVSVGPGATEYSRAIPVGAENNAMFEVWYRGRTPGTSATLDTVLQGSNNLTQWTDLGLTSQLTTAPGYDAKTHTTVIPWALLRLKYTVTSASSGTVSLSSTITTFEEG